MREQSVTHLIAYCLNNACRHQARSARDTHPVVQGKVQQVRPWWPLGERDGLLASRCSSRPRVATRSGSGRDGAARHRDPAVARPPTHPPRGAVCALSVGSRVEAPSVLFGNPRYAAALRYPPGSHVPYDCFLYGAARDRPPFARIQKCRGPPLAPAVGFFSLIAGRSFRLSSGTACVFFVFAGLLYCPSLSRISGMLL